VISSTLDGEDVLDKADLPLLHLSQRTVWCLGKIKFEVEVICMQSIKKEEWRTDQVLLWYTTYMVGVGSAQVQAWTRRQ
jgi:hypothetical protein